MIWQVMPKQAHELGIKKFDIYGSAVDETSVQVDHGSLNKSKPQIALM